MLKKWITGIVCSALLLGSAAFAAPQGEIELDPGEEFVFQVPDIRILSADAVNINGKKMIYGKAADKNVYAYDVTDPENIVLVSKVATSGADKGVLVWQDHLIYATNQKFEVRQINSDGSLAGTALKTVDCSAVEKIKIIDGILFASTNYGIKLFDVRTVAEPDSIVQLSVAEKVKCRDFVVQKVDSGYRLFMLQPKDLEQKYPVNENDKLQTIYLKICDVKHGTWAVQELYNDIPETHVWPGYGWYGEENTGEGYIGFSENNNGSLNEIGEGILRLTTTSGTIPVANDDFIIDAQDPAAPKVVCFEAQERDSFAPFQVHLGNNLYVLLRQYNSNPGKVVRDYTDPANPKTLRTLGTAGGDMVVTLDNMLYSFGTVNKVNSICITKLYEEYIIKDFSLEKGTGSATATFVLDNNISRTQQLMLIAASYADGKMTGIRYVPCVADAFEKNAEFTAEVTVSAEGGTVKAWVIDNFKNMDILTDILN